MPRPFFLVFSLSLPKVSKVFPPSFIKNTQSIFPSLYQIYFSSLLPKNILSSSFPKKMSKIFSLLLKKNNNFFLPFKKINSYFFSSSGRSHTLGLAPYWLRSSVEPPSSSVNSFATSVESKIHPLSMENRSSTKCAIGFDEGSSPAHCQD